MIELKSENLQSAIELARANRKSLLVKMTGIPRQYIVINKNTGGAYTVVFAVKNNNQKFGSCNCRAGEHGRLCKHIAAAAALNTCLAERGVLNQLSAQIS